jgi:hypothetical protein
MIYANKYGYKVKGGLLDYSLLGKLSNFHWQLPMGCDIVLHYGTEGQHAKKGFHPRGMAVDLHIEKDDNVMPLAEQYAHAHMFWIGGIGVYPFWQHQGLHLDIGPDGRRWWQNKDKSYLRLDTLNWDTLTSRVI